MVVKRKKKIIDGMDRELLRNLMESRRALTANQLSKKVKLTPSAIRPRLDNLKSKGIIKPIKTTGIRTFKRGNKIIKSPRSIHWGIDLKKSRKKR